MLRLAAVALVALAGVAHAERVVAVAPLSMLGAEDKSQSTKKIVGQIEAAIASLPGNKVITAAKVAEAIDKAKKPQLKACEGDPACVTELGKLIGAQVVISGEVGGLGDSRVIYLGATDVTTGKELRSTTLTIGSKDDAGGATGAAIRLLDPDQYRGTIHLAIDVGGATVFVNGSKASLTGKGELALPVGTQAIRVTHPQYHDFIKFVDVPYGKTLDVPVAMTQYPISEHDVHAKPTSRDKVEYIDPPWYRRPLFVGIGAAVLAVGAGVAIGLAVHDFPPYDQCRKLGGMQCP